MYQFIKFFLQFLVKLGPIVIGIILVNGCVTRPPSTIMPQDQPSSHIPTATTTYPLEATPTYHVVKRGDTLSSIAKMYGIDRYQDLANWNNISSPYLINPGDRLQVSAPLNYTSATTHPVHTQSSIQKTVLTNTATISQPIKSSGSDYHSVRSGENLYNIAKVYGRTVPELAAWNQLSPPYLLAEGQSLRVLPPVTNRILSVPATPVDTIDHHHTVQRGDTLYNVAHRYRQGVADIARWNNLQPPYTLFLGQRLLVVPPGIATTSHVKPMSTVGSSETLYHSISAGDTLYSISKMYGYSVDQIATWNSLHPPYNNLKVGTNLRVSPSTQKTMAAVQNQWTINVPTSTTVQHVVKEGETVYSIARRYGVTAFDLSVWNGIGKPYTIYPGQKLKIIR